ncbi:MAG: ThuA domain-containing protein [Planctomycetota bacterium]|jgi:type 1 glutamine amidotransferase
MKTILTKRVVGLALLAGLLSTIVAAGAQPKEKPRREPPELSAADLEKIEAAVPASATARPGKPRRLLVFWRCEGFFHGSGIAGGNKALDLLGKKTGAFTADFSDDYAVFDPSNLANYDGVVLNNTTRIKLPDEAKKQALLDFVNGGKGLIGIHAATDNFYEWPEAAAMMGGLFDGHPWGGSGTWAFKIDAPDHVLTRAFEGRGFKLKDEIYQLKDPYTRADRRVLLSLDLSDPATGGVTRGVKRTDKDFAVAWVKNVGKGRVFYCSLGHGANVFGEPAVVRFYLDGIQFALGDLEADASPE